MYDVVALGELLIDFTCQSVDPAGYPTMAAHTLSRNPLETCPKRA